MPIDQTEVVATQPSVRHPYRVRRSIGGTMSKLARALVLAATLAALNLVGITAIAHAQANDQGTPSQQELADRWTYYHLSTQTPPAELKARMQADAAQRALSDRWSYYDHATQMSPAELKAWAQARDRTDTSTETPAQVPAPVRPDQPSGQPVWLVVSLEGLAAALALVAGLALLAARRANRRARVGLAG
jgi:hypothetical protein